MIYRATAKIVVGILLFCSLFLTPLTVKAENEELITAPHGVLMEASTGKIIYEKDMDTRVKPASKR